MKKKKKIEYFFYCRRGDTDEKMKHGSGGLDCETPTRLGSFHTEAALCAESRTHTHTHRKGKGQRRKIREVFNSIPRKGREGIIPTGSLTSRGRPTTRRDTLKDSPANLMILQRPRLQSATLRFWMDSFGTILVSAGSAVAAAVAGLGGASPRS